MRNILTNEICKLVILSLLEHFVKLMLFEDVKYHVHHNTYFVLQNRDGVIKLDHLVFACEVLKPPARLRLKIKPAHRHINAHVHWY